MMAPRECVLTKESEMKGKSQGIQSNKFVQPGVRIGRNAAGVTPGYAGQLGNKIGAHATDSGDLRPKPEPMHGKSPHMGVKLGNEMAHPAGPHGQGRAIHRSGSQAHHGPANPGMPEPEARGLDVRGRGSKTI
jgi:hypothetical protein